MKEHLIFRELLAAQGIEHTPEEAKKIFELLDRIFGQKSEIIRSGSSVAEHLFRKQDTGVRFSPGALV